MAVEGIGGYFFRAEDPDGLKASYREHLGVGGGVGSDPVTGHANEWVWYTQGGPVVFSPFPASSDYFAADKQAMLNLRVSDLAGLLEKLKSAGIVIEREEQHDGVGAFARVHDPEGNPIELWEPPAAS